MPDTAEQKRKPIILISPDHPDIETQGGKRLPDEYTRYAIQWVEHYGCEAVLLPKHADTHERLEEIEKWVKMADGLIVMGDDYDPIPQPDQRVHPLEYIVYALESVKSNDPSPYAKKVRHNIGAMLNHPEMKKALQPLIAQPIVAYALQRFMDSEPPPNPALGEKELSPEELTYALRMQLATFTPADYQRISAIASRIHGLGELLHPALHLPPTDDLDGMPRTICEKHAIATALHHDVPVLGLCGGFQKALQNFGTRFEHLPTEIVPKLRIPLPHPQHIGPEISVYAGLGGRNIARTQGTIFTAPLLKPASPTILTPEAAEFIGENVAMLTSWSEHKWGTTVEDIHAMLQQFTGTEAALTSQLKILAKSPDGIVDMVGITGKFLGIQRHPEMAQDRNDYRFFTWITSQAKAHAAQHPEAHDVRSVIANSVGEEYRDSENFVQAAIAPLHDAKARATQHHGAEFAANPHAEMGLQEWLKFNAAARGVGG